MPAPTFNPSDTNPELHVDREGDLAWLSGEVEARLMDGSLESAAWLVTGAKGSGKTIFVKRVLRALKAQHPQDTLFIEVDCRTQLRSRTVLRDVAQRTVGQLEELRRRGGKVSSELHDAAQALLAIARLDEAELRVVHENVAQYKASLGAEVKLAVKNTLNTVFGVSLERSVKDSKALSGSVKFTEQGLCEVFCAFFRDLREAGYTVVLFIDNLDELEHDYKDEKARQRVREEARWVQQITTSPIVSVLCMRSYFASVARPGLIGLALDPLTPTLLLGILEARIKKERPDVRTEYDTRSEVRALTQWIAGAAKTPLAALHWLRWFWSRNAFEPRARKQEVWKFVRSAYPGVPEDLIQRVAQDVDDPTIADRSTVLQQACQGKEVALALLQDHEVILPNDFWNPLQFTLDPTLATVQDELR